MPGRHRSGLRTLRSGAWTPRGDLAPGPPRSRAGPWQAAFNPCRNPGPLGQVRVQRLCQLYDSMLLNDRVVPTTEDQGVTNESI